MLRLFISLSTSPNLYLVLGAAISTSAGNRPNKDSNIIGKLTGSLGDRDTGG